MKLLSVLLYTCFLLLAALSGASQTSCNSCTTNISKDSLVHIITVTDVTSYTIGAGETLCIMSSGTFKGTLTLNGGVVCNKGRFFPSTFTFNSGSICNKNNMHLKSSLTLGSSRSVSNTKGAVINVTGGITLSGGSLNNEGLINASGTLQNTSGTLTNKTIINCNVLSGSNTITSYGIGIINTKN